MRTTETSKESGRAGKPGEPTANGERGSHAHATDGSQAETNLTAEGVASLLKSDFAAAVEAIEEDLETRSDTEAPPQTTETEATRAKPEPTEEPGEEDEPAAGAEDEEPTTTKPKNPEAAAEVTAWKEHIAGLEKKLEDAEGKEAEDLEHELNEARKEMAEWTKLAKGEPEGGTPGTELPAALQSAIEEWEAQGGGALPEPLQKLVDKSIHRITRQRETEKTRADQAEARVAELEQRLESRGDATASPLQDPKQLDHVESVGEKCIEELEAAIDGTATEEEAKRVQELIGSERLDTPEAQRAMKRQLRQVQKIVAGVPAQRQRVQQFRSAEAQASSVARKVFPFLGDKAHGDYAEAQRVLQTMPGIRTATPAWEMAIGTYVLGLRELKRLQPQLFQGNGNGNGPRRAPTKLPRKAPGKSPTSGSGAAAPRGAKTRALDVEEQHARAQHERRPTKESVERLLKIGFRKA